MAQSRFPVLDAVRGLAFLIVVLAHLGQARGLATTGTSQFGVWIFFVLSAFLLSRPFLETPGRVRNPKEIKTYFLRRALRIFPPLALSLAAYALVFPNYTWKACGEILLCVRGYDIFWTIFMETRYYLLLPLAVAALLALGSRPKVLFAAFAAGIALLVYVRPFGLPRHPWQAMSFDPASTWIDREYLFFQFLPVFLGGTLLAAVHCAMAESQVSRAQMRRWAPVGFMAALFGFAACSSAELGLFPWQAVARIPFQILWLPLLPLPLALVFSAANLDGGLARFFGNPLFCYFGQISYSGYLFHEIFVQRLNLLIENSVLYACAVLTATLAAATAGHYLVERPFIALSHSRSSSRG